ncbi:MAG: glycine--tRNA ligase [Candidatus Terrybacteria bacterium RIFCSPLOWO2_01_FULL_40_23]|uniref:Glycine--tRNA ligase n=1 Tax=Candidatus Terrybacteria bacterium RIFCSPLOWO2_01_FULL_40_23 TaxID=1802366 RepID=A0A1G2PW93_9BACT|nr:MAG: glycine--tRNA ligase [Candidatus Terrybacteria bacterium RIFCSPLOWO2_01_FULL_40_23]
MTVDLETIIDLAKQRGFIFPSSEIYGGFKSSYDYGPLGVELKNNIKRLWWKEMVYKRDDIVGLDAAIMMSSKVWEASGHTSAGFADLLSECIKCHKRWRRDHVDDVCPDCGGALSEPKKFNLLVRTHLGPVEDESTQAFMRPETAQGIFVNFSLVAKASRKKLPFGIAQIGKAFRNEITPGPFTFRMREFEQMEMQWFYDPANNNNWYEFWKEQRMAWYKSIGIDPEKLRFHDHAKDELAHYAKAAVDIEYEYPWGWGEFEGIHDRGEWDLSNHMKHSGQDMRIFDEETKEAIMPHVIETSGGVDRSVLVALMDAYRSETVDKEERVYLAFHPSVAPVKIAVLPLVKNKENIVAKAKEIANMLRGRWLIQYDEAGTVGRRYRRQDEIGTPFCVTIDFDTLEDNAVTIRMRDTMEQIRKPIEELKAFFEKQFN